MPKLSPTNLKSPLPSSRLNCMEGLMVTLDLQSVLPAVMEDSDACSKVSKDLCKYLFSSRPEVDSELVPIDVLTSCLKLFLGSSLGLIPVFIMPIVSYRAKGRALHRPASSCNYAKMAASFSWKLEIDSKLVLIATQNIRRNDAEFNNQPEPGSDIIEQTARLLKQAPGLCNARAGP
ncbi:hypothetical protein VNO77_44861 [Canavalia gladiata]|uniref:Uncharacterized protein n=1 Tax=Canavalia gladiata TaxID=3824 RepID=A0AAN9JWW7_CANGL